MKGDLIGYVASRSRKGRHWRVVKLVRIPARDMTKPGLWENQRFYMRVNGKDVEWLERPHHATQLNAKEAERWARGWNEHTVAMDSDKKKGV